MHFLGDNVYLELVDKVREPVQFQTTLVYMQQIHQEEAVKALKGAVLAGK